MIMNRRGLLIVNVWNLKFLISITYFCPCIIFVISCIMFGQFGECKIINKAIGSMSCWSVHLSSGNKKKNPANSSCWHTSTNLINKISRWITLRSFVGWTPVTHHQFFHSWWAYILIFWSNERRELFCRRLDWVVSCSFEKYQKSTRWKKSATIFTKKKRLFLLPSLNIWYPLRNNLMSAFKSYHISFFGWGWWNTKNVTTKKYWSVLLGYTCVSDNSNTDFSTWVEKINLHLSCGKLTFSLDATNKVKQIDKWGTKCSRAYAEFLFSFLFPLHFHLNISWSTFTLNMLFVCTVQRGASLVPQSEEINLFIFLLLIPSRFAWQAEYGAHLYAANFTRSSTTLNVNVQGFPQALDREVFGQYMSVQSTLHVSRSTFISTKTHREHWFSERFEMCILHGNGSTWPGVVNHPKFKSSNKLCTFCWNIKSAWRSFLLAMTLKQIFC